LSGAFGRMLRCARSTAGSARPPPSRASPAAKFARSNVLLWRLPFWVLFFPWGYPFFSGHFGHPFMTSST